MIFGLIKTTREWYQSDAAILRFRDHSIATLVIWSFFLFLYFRHPLLEEIQMSIAGAATILLLGMILGVTFITLVFGMGWYLWCLDTSPIRVKILWLLAALILSPFVEVAYFVFVYRPQVLQTRRARVTVPL